MDKKKVIFLTFIGISFINTVTAWLITTDIKTFLSPVEHNLVGALLTTFYIIALNKKSIKEFIRRNPTWKKYIDPHFLVCIIVTAMIYYVVPKMKIILFWGSVIAWLTWSLKFLTDKNGKVKILQYFISAWYLLTVFLTLGSSEFIFDENIYSSLSSIHPLLDIRETLFYIIVVILLVKAINKAIEIKIEVDDYLKLGSNDKMYLEIVNLILIPFNQIAKFLIYIVKFVFIVGNQFGGILTSSISNSINQLLHSFRIGLIVISLWVITLIATETTSFLELVQYKDQSYSLLILSLFTCLLLLIMLATNLLRNTIWSENKFVVETQNFENFAKDLASGSSFIFASTWLAGLIIYLLSKIEILKVSTRATPDIYTIIVTTLFLLGLGYQVFAFFQKKKMDSAVNTIENT